MSIPENERSGTEHKERLVKVDGSINMEVIGLHRPLGSDLFHYLHTVTWLRFFLSIVVVYIAVNVVFAGLYLLDPGGIANLEEGGFWGAFFFSVQTFSTIGYGVLSPVTPYSNGVVAVEAIFGMLLNAVVTGSFFSKFSRPEAKVLFSEVAIVGMDQGEICLMFRLANRRRNQIVDAQMNLTLSIDEFCPDGTHFRRSYSLRLKRERSSLFALSWTVMHPINESSPLFGHRLETLQKVRAIFIVTLQGIDDTLGQGVHARHIYEIDEIVWGARFKDILHISGPGPRRMDYRQFHKYERVPLVSKKEALGGDSLP